MRIGIATDHGGFSLKEEFVAQLHAAGHEVVDFGAYSLNPTDDTPVVVLLASAVATGEVGVGGVCGSGVGASVCVRFRASARDHSRPLLGRARR